MDISVYESNMQKIVDYLATEFKSVQVWKASTGMVDNITVEASYGPMKVPQIAHVSIMDSQTIKIEPWDKKECKNIEKAVYNAELWLVPKNEWEYVLVKVPELTKENREELVKKVKAMWEEQKWHIRKVRQDAQKESKRLLADKEISEDEHKNNEMQIDKITKEFGSKIDELVKSKSEEILTV